MYNDKFDRDVEFEYAKISDISNIEFSSVIDQVYDKEGIKLVAK